ncbi:hypothetical protein O0V02_16200 [Gordonia amicalis]|nr:hypothetical protein [Gordonia amicalis]
MSRFEWSPGLSRRVKALLTCGVLLGTGAIGTTALWSTTAATVSGQFTTATIAIRANSEVAHTFTFPGTLLPGDTTAYVVDVQNIGGVQFSYTASRSSSSPLAQAMLLSARYGLVANVSGTTTSCSGGTSVGPIAIGSTMATIASRGPLAAGTGVERWCFQLSLPATASSTLAGTTGAVTFTFSATGP